MPDIRVILVLAAAYLLVFVLLPQLTRPPVQVIEVSLSEWEINPETITLEANPGGIKFVVTNDGTIEHAFEVEGEVKGQEREWEVEDIQPGETKTLNVKLSPGQYEVYCPLPGHRDKGMEAVLLVEKAPGGY